MVVFMAALTERTTMKYGELGDYFPLIECGYVGSMIHQYSSQIGAHFAPWGLSGQKVFSGPISTSMKRNPSFMP